MTLPQFLNVIENAPDIRWRKELSSGRARIMTAHLSTPLSPLAFVAKQILGAPARSDVRSNDFRKAAAHMGLSVKSLERIHDASEDLPSTDPEVRIIREALEKACRL